MTVPAHPQPIVAPAADIQTADSFNTDLRVRRSLPPLNLVISKNLRTAIEAVEDRADAPAPASIENAASRAAAGQRTPMSKKRRLVTPSGGSPDDKGSDDDAQPELKASAATAKGTGRNARKKGKAKGTAKAKVPAGGVTIARDRPIGPPFSLRRRQMRHNFVCELLGTFDGLKGRPITSTSLNTSLNYNTIMNTILEEANAGALTTKGQAADRREELLEIERAGCAGFAEANARGEPSSGGTAATAEHRAAGEFFGEEFESQEGLGIH